MHCRQQPALKTNGPKAVYLIVLKDTPMNATDLQLSVMVSSIDTCTAGSSWHGYVQTRDSESDRPEGQFLYVRNVAHSCASHSTTCDHDLQAAPGIGIYGSPTAYCIALKDAPGCNEFLLPAKL